MIRTTCVLLLRRRTARKSRTSHLQSAKNPLQLTSTELLSPLHRKFGNNSTTLIPPSLPTKTTWEVFTSGLKWPLLNKIRQSVLYQPQRVLSGDAASTATSAGGRDGETKIKLLLLKAFPSAKTVTVNDISGGCGSMYQVQIESKDFEGLSIVKQHQLVNKALENEIKEMHGIRITTQVPK